MALRGSYQLFLALTLAVVPLTRCSVHQQAQRSSDEMRSSLIAVEEAWSHAFAANDVSAIERHMAPDWRVISPQGHVLDRATFLQLIARGVLIHSAMQLSDLEVRVYGDVGIVNGVARSSGIFQGAPFSEVERITDVFVWRDGQWRCVLTHLTRVESR